MPLHALVAHTVFEMLNENVYGPISGIYTKRTTKLCKRSQSAPTQLSIAKFLLSYSYVFKSSTWNAKVMYIELMI